MAFLLRHDKAYPFDEHGWREIADLIANHDYIYGGAEGNSHDQQQTTV